VKIAPKVVDIKLVINIQLMVSLSPIPESDMKKSPTKKPDLEFAERLLLGLVNEAAAAETAVKRTRLAINTLAKEFGIAIPKPEKA
jgi:hypothetical protein